MMNCEHNCEGSLGAIKECNSIFTGGSTHPISKTTELHAKNSGCTRKEDEVKKNYSDVDKTSTRHIRASYGAYSHRKFNPGANKFGKRNNLKIRSRGSRVRNETCKTSNNHSISNNDKSDIPTDHGTPKSILSLSLQDWPLLSSTTKVNVPAAPSLSKAPPLSVCGNLTKDTGYVKELDINTIPSNLVSKSLGRTTSVCTGPEQGTCATMMVSKEKMKMVGEVEAIYRSEVHAPDIIGADSGNHIVSLVTRKEEQKNTEQFKRSQKGRNMDDTKKQAAQWKQVDSGTGGNEIASKVTSTPNYSTTKAVDMRYNQNFADYNFVGKVNKSTMNIESRALGEDSIHQTEDRKSEKRTSYDASHAASYCSADEFPNVSGKNHFASMFNSSVDTEDTPTVVDSVPFSHATGGKSMVPHLEETDRRIETGYVAGKKAGQRDKMFDKSEAGSHNNFATKGSSATHGIANYSFEGNQIQNSSLFVQLENDPRDSDCGSSPRYLCKDTSSNTNDNAVSNRKEAEQTPHIDTDEGTSSPRPGQHKESRQDLSTNAKFPCKGIPSAPDLLMPKTGLPAPWGFYGWDGAFYPLSHGFDSTARYSHVHLQWLLDTTLSHQMMAVTGVMPFVPMQPCQPIPFFGSCGPGNLCEMFWIMRDQVSPVYPLPRHQPPSPRAASRRHR